MQNKCRHPEEKAKFQGIYKQSSSYPGSLSPIKTFQNIIPIFIRRRLPPMSVAFIMGEGQEGMR